MKIHQKSADHFADYFANLLTILAIFMQFFGQQAKISGKHKSLKTPAFKPKNKGGL